MEGRYSEREGARRSEPPLHSFWWRGLDRPDVDCLRTLVAGLRLVLHARALGERAVAVGFDAAVVDEEVLAAFIGCDEAEALLVAEPLNGALCHVFPPRRLSCCVCRGSSKGNRLRAPALLSPDIVPGPNFAHRSTVAGRRASLQSRGHVALKHHLYDSANGKT